MKLHTKLISLLILTLVAVVTIVQVIQYYLITGLIVHSPDGGLGIIKESLTEVQSSKNNIL